jgi:hypothetical protein
MDERLVDGDEREEERGVVREILGTCARLRIIIPFHHMLPPLHCFGFACLSLRVVTPYGGRAQ